MTHLENDPLRSETQAKAEAVAIIGLSGRFPGARDVEALWRNLLDGVESIARFTDGELRSVGVPEAALKHPAYVKAGSVIEDAEMFDAAFFGINPREAEVMDPQQRVFLECAWEILERAGYDPSRYPGAIAVYGGMGLNTYGQNVMSNREVLAAVGGFQAMLGNDKDFLATRVSYKLDLKGPSFTVQTACSTSLVASHLAAESLLSYQCDMAVAGGVSIFFPQKVGYLYQEGMILSPDGHCRAFDAAARGTVITKGAAMVLLKRLSDAVADGDHVYAVIKGSAINNDGSDKVGYTAPSVHGQAEVIADALAVNDIDPATIAYVEAHGTGTELGDPIEIEALNQVYRARTERKQYCAIGSIKTNVGHMDTAAGAAGLIKTALAIDRGILPKSLHFESQNPRIDFESSPFFVNRETRPWKVEGGPRRAAVSSFGIGGTNAHMVLEEAPASEAPAPDDEVNLFLLSARSDSALETMTENLERELSERSDLSPSDVAYTLQIGRRAFRYRRAFVAKDLEGARTCMRTGEGLIDAVQDASERASVFLFPGQGAQYPGMARGLYEASALFRKEVDFCSELLRPELSLDLRDVLFASADDEAKRRLDETALTQPALFVVEYALACLLMSLGIVPDAMLGHSLGEYVAACLASVFTLESALKLVATRGRLMQEMPRGSMLAVPLSLTEVERVRRDLGLEDALSLAAVNGPSLVVLSGEEAAIEALESGLASRGLPGRKLHTSHAFHSGMMDSMLPAFRQVLEEVEMSPPRLRYVSNLTGEWILPEEAVSPEYWVRHLRHTVQYSRGMETLLAEGAPAFLEVGPGKTLQSLLRAQDGSRTALSCLPGAKEKDAGASDEGHFKETLGRAWLEGVAVEWGPLHDKRRRRVALPTYPFERQRFWVDRVQQAPALGRRIEKKADVGDWFYLPSWTRKDLLTARRDVPAGFRDGSGTALVFMTDATAGSLGEALAARHESVVRVFRGSVFADEGDGRYRVRPGAREDYAELFQALRRRGLTPARVWHLFTLDDPEEATLLRGDDLGFFSLLFLAQLLTESWPEATVGIDVVTRGLYEVTGSETLRPEVSTLIGPAKMIPAEYPKLSVRLVDIGDEDPEALALALALRLQDEARVIEPGAVAYRGRHRWVQSYEPIHLDTPGPDELPFRDEGVYLVTGGLGGIGLALSEYLAREHRAKLVFTGRSRLPGREGWSDILETRDASDATRAKIEKVLELEKLGAEVEVLAADVTSEKAMKDVVRKANERFGALHGVVHAAGVAGGGIMQVKSRADAEAVLSPKVRGTAVLSRALADAKLDFFVLCSSMNSVIPVAGQVDYCAANAYEDVFAHYHAARNGGTAMSINWDTWQEVGMAVNTEVPAAWQAMKEESLRLGLSPKDGVECFLRALARRAPQIVVSTKDLPGLIAYSERLRAKKKADATPEKAGSPEAPPSPQSRERHKRPDLATPFVEPRDETEARIAAVWQEVLGIARVGVHDNFFELGGHSLLATLIASRLRDAFHVELPLRNVFDAATVEELAESVRNVQWLLEEQDQSTPSTEGDREEIEI